MASIDIHIIQSVPPSNINRDDNGSPKTAVYGGVRRARVSSQAWKRAARDSFGELLDMNELGIRTKRAAELIAVRIVATKPEVTLEEALKGAWGVLGGLGLKEEKARKSKTDTGEEKPSSMQYLVFFSNVQLDKLAELAIEHDLGKVPASVAKNAVKRDYGISLSLFGRMVANDPDLNVDAAVQVAHALSTHAVDPEFDFYTAVDDYNPGEETGAGMMGTIEYNSSTMYRYATVSLDGLNANLGDPEATARAVEAFLTGFVKAMPSGKQNTFANGTLPHGVVVMARKGQGVNLVGAFEDAVRLSDNGYIHNSCEALAKHAGELDGAFGEAPEEAWVTRVGDAAAPLETLGEVQAFPALVKGVGEYVRSTLGASA